MVNGPLLKRSSVADTLDWRHLPGSQARVWMLLGLVIHALGGWGRAFLNEAWGLHEMPSPAGWGLLKMCVA